MNLSSCHARAPVHVCVTDHISRCAAEEHMPPAYASRSPRTLAELPRQPLPAATDNHSAGCNVCAAGRIQQQEFDKSPPHCPSSSPWPYSSALTPPPPLYPRQALSISFLEESSESSDIPDSCPQDSSLVLAWCGARGMLAIGFLACPQSRLLP